MTKFSSAPILDDHEVGGASVEARVSGVGATAVGALEVGGASAVGVHDMRDKEIAEVEAELNGLLSGGDTVLTGSVGIEGGLIEEFDPARSELGSKKPSVYATDDPETAIFNAVVDKHSDLALVIRRMDGGEGASSGMLIRQDGAIKFGVPEMMAKAIRRAIELGPDSEQWKALFRDGAVYALPKDKFTQDSARTDGVEEPTDHEWNSQEAVEPGRAVAVSASLIKDVLRFDGEDANAQVVFGGKDRFLAAAKEQFEEAMASRVSELGSEDLVAISGESGERREFAEFVGERMGRGKLPKEEFLGLVTKLYIEFLENKYLG